MTFSLVRLAHVSVACHAHGLTLGTQGLGLRRWLRARTRRAGCLVARLALPVPLLDVRPQVGDPLGHAVEADLVEEPGQVIGDGLPLDQDGQEGLGAGVDEAALLEEVRIDVIEEQRGPRSCPPACDAGARDRPRRRALRSAHVGTPTAREPPPFGDQAPRIPWGVGPTRGSCCSPGTRTKAAHASRLTGKTNTYDGPLDWITAGRVQVYGAGREGREAPVRRWEGRTPSPKFLHAEHGEHTSTSEHKEHRGTV